LNENKNYSFSLLVFICCASMNLLIFGCGQSNSPVSTQINPETGGTSNGTFVTFTANNLQVDLNNFELSGQTALVYVTPLTSSGGIDRSTNYTYSFSSDDSYWSYVPISGVGPYYTFVSFNSVVHHSPLVHLTVTGNGGGNTVGPETASSFMWVYSVPAGDIMYENSNPQGQVANDIIMPTPTNHYYVSLPNEIINPTVVPTITPANNVFVKVVNAISGPVTGQLVGVGPWYGGPDTKLPCYNSGGGVCDNYWNWQWASGYGIPLCSSESNYEFGQEPWGPTSPNNQLRIGLSNDMFNALQEDSSISGESGNGSTNNVDWRFN
jgi:hypothetical protein